MNDQRFFESMEIIDTVVQTIQRSKDHATSLNLQAGTQIAGDVMFMTYIRICIVLDELRKLNGLSKEDERLKLIFSSLKPFYQYARKYEKGFDSVRNILVAHYNRNESGKYISFIERLSTFNVPRSSGELYFICDCLECMRLILFKNYPAASTYVISHIQTVQENIKKFGTKFEPKSPLDIEDFKRTVNKDLVKNGLVAF